MNAFKDAEDKAKSALLAEEVKAKGWFSAHKLLWIVGLAGLIVGMVIGKLL